MGLRILIADGNADSAESLALLLEYHGHIAVAVNSGPDVLKTAASFVPEAAFLSLHLPLMNGYEVCRQLCSGLYCQRPGLLVALTGDGRERDVRETVAAGFDHHLLKPAPLEAILDLLNHRHSSARSDAPQAETSGC